MLVPYEMRVRRGGSPRSFFPSHCSSSVSGLFGQFGVQQDLPSAFARDSFHVPRGGRCAPRCPPSHVHRAFIYRSALGLPSWETILFFRVCCVLFSPLLCHRTWKQQRCATLLRVRCPSSGAAASQSETTDFPRALLLLFSTLKDWICPARSRATWERGGG